MGTNKLLLLGGFMILVSLGLLVYTSMTTQDKIGASKAQDDTHCPDCGREMPRGSVGECPFCKLAQSRGEKGKGEKSARGGRFTTTNYVIFGCILFLAFGGGYLMWRSTAQYRKGRKREVATYRTRCPKCKRRVRYTASQIGRTVLCPTCRYTLQLKPPKAG
jgi:hypothetical protein